MRTGVSGPPLSTPVQNSALFDVRQHLLTSKKVEALRKGWGKVPDMVFCTEEGAPLDGDNLPSVPRWMRHRSPLKLL